MSANFCFKGQLTHYVSDDKIDPVVQYPIITLELLFIFPSPLCGRVMRLLEMAISGLVCRW